MKKTHTTAKQNIVLLVLLYIVDIISITSITSIMGTMRKTQAQRQFSFRARTAHDQHLVHGSFFISDLWVWVSGTVLNACVFVASRETFRPF